MSPDKLLKFIGRIVSIEAFNILSESVAKKNSSDELPVFDLLYQKTKF